MVNRLSVRANGSNLPPPHDWLSNPPPGLLPQNATQQKVEFAYLCHCAMEGKLAIFAVESAGLKARCRCVCTCARSFPSVLPISATTASIASAEVPDMRPTMKVELSFRSPRHERRLNEALTGDKVCSEQLNIGLLSNQTCVVLWRQTAGGLMPAPAKRIIFYANIDRRNSVVQKTKELCPGNP